MHPIAFLFAVAAVAPRVYVAPIASESAGKESARLIEARLLVEARTLKDRFDVVGAGDLRDVLDAEAVKQAMGCDSTSCADEVAGALNAEQLVTGQLGRIGDTWQLTLTRTEQKTLRVLGRAQRTSHGDTAEGLLDDIPAMVDEVFGVATPPLAVAGYVGVGAGAVGLAGGLALYGLSWLDYESALTALTKATPDVDGARTDKNNGEAVLFASYIVGGVGVAAAIAGGVLAVIGASE